MKITRLLLSTAIAVSTLFFISCKKESKSASAINYQLKTSNPSAVISRTTAGNMLWTSGYGYATEIKFEAKSSNIKVEYKSLMAQRIDLFSAVASLGNITLPPGTYSEVEFKVYLNQAGSNAAFELNGQFTSGGITTPVAFNVNTPLEVENEKNNVIITDNTSYKALTTLNLALITRGVTESMFNNATRTGGKIIISATSNANIYNIILNNLTDCDGVEFEKD